MDGCSSLAEVYYRGKFISKDINKANFYLQKYIAVAQQKCDKNDAQMCYGMGNMYAQGFIKNNVVFVKQEKAKASYYFKKSCKLGYQDSCRKYAGLNNIPYNEPIHIAPLAEERP
jgi:TPR repeat protein